MPARPSRVAPWLGAVAALALAVGAGLVLAQILLAPQPRDLRLLAAYLAFSGATTLAVGWLAVRFADHAVRLSIRSRAFLGAATGSGVALLNVLIVAQLMFLSTAHDLKLLVALLVFSAVVTLFFSLWVAWTVTKRLMAVTAGISALASGDYAGRVIVSGGDEVARLAGDVNSLAQRLQASAAQRLALDRERRELTAAISHDLRTPLASVRAMVEALDDHIVDDPAEIARHHGTMRREIERLNRMIQDLFELAQMDAGALRLDRQPVALQEIAAEVVDAMQAQAQRDGVALGLTVAGEPHELLLDGAWIERALANLLRNALEHTPPGGQVEVRVAATDGCVELCVADSGEGIEEADLPRIWERFYRAERSRGRGPRGSDGAGLGLAIVRGIVEMHAGSLGVQSAPGQGATFSMRLPYNADGR